MTCRETESGAAWLLKIKTMAEKQTTSFRDLINGDTPVLFNN